MNTQKHTVLVCLHGWGGSKESFTELRQALRNTAIAVHTPDLPGFGNESEPKKPWTTDDYADWVIHWILKNTPQDNDTQLYLLGHSHGGRIALKIAHRQCVDSHQKKLPKTIQHIFLCAPAGIRHARHFKRIIGLILAKTGKVALSLPLLNKLVPLGKKLLYTLVRVHDYERASDIMRKTLINVSRENLRPLLRYIRIPTDLFWGKDDGMTPFSDALIMEKEIPECSLHAFEGVRHSVHRDRAMHIASTITSRIT